MTYFVAVQFDETGAWVETFGDRDKENVDFEVQCWKDTGIKRGQIKRGEFKHVPSNSQLRKFVYGQD